MIRSISFRLMLLFQFVTFMTLNGIGQNTVTLDSLDLTPLISKVIAAYPTVQQAAEALTAADLKIELARTSFLPNAQMAASVAHIGPVPSLTLPEVGSFSLAPKNPMNAAVSMNQLLSDFGRSKASVDYEEKCKLLALLGMEQVKQRLASTIISTYYNLLYYQEAIQIREQQIVTLKEHLKNVETKATTGSATQYEILSTKVRISNIESQKTDMQTALNFQNAMVNMLLGQEYNFKNCVHKKFQTGWITANEDSLVSIALSSRKEIQLVEKKLILSKSMQELAKKHENPVLSAFASGGWKNGYIPELDRPKANYAVGINLQIPIYDAGRTDLNVKLASSASRSNNFELDLTRRTVTAEVVEGANSLKSSVAKSELFEMQLSQAMKALELAKLKFKAGTITNLDLLDAENAASESSLQLLKTRIDKALIYYKLRAALGYDLY